MASVCVVSPFLPPLFLVLGGFGFEVGDHPAVRVEERGDAGLDFRRRLVRLADGELVVEYEVEFDPVGPSRVAVAEIVTPISPPSGPTQWLFQGPPAESKFLAAVKYGRRDPV